MNSEVSDAVHLFTRKRDFVDWATSISPRTAETGRHVAVGFDAISWSLKAAIVPQTEMPPWASTQLSLPVGAAHARDVWGSIQEDNLCLFFHLELDLGSILVAARGGAWRSLDDQGLPYPKGRFSELHYEDAKRLVNDSMAWRALWREALMFGLGCRILLRQCVGPAILEDAMEREADSEG